MTSEDVEARRLHRGLRRAFGETLRQVEGAWIEERAGYAVVACPAIPIPGFNGVWVDGPDVMAPQTLAGAVDEVRCHGAPCWIELRADRTPAIRAAAVGLGFMREDAYPGMVATPQEVWLPGPGGPQISRVEGPSAIEAIDVAAAGFEAPRELFAALYTPAVLAVPGLSVYLLWIGGRAVSTATAWLGDGTVGIFNVATPPAERGHGYGTLITAHAAWEGFAAGADLAWLQASAMGEPVYRRMGFRQVETYEVLVRHGLRAPRTGDYTRGSARSAGCRHTIARCRRVRLRSRSYPLPVPRPMAAPVPEDDRRLAIDERAGLTGRGRRTGARRRHSGR